MGGKEGIQLTQDSNQWQLLVLALYKLRKLMNPLMQGRRSLDHIQTGEKDTIM